MEGVQGYNEDQIALVVPDLSNFVAQVPIIFRNPHYKLCSECYEGEGDRCPGNAVGKCLGVPISCQCEGLQPQLLPQGLPMQNAYTELKTGSKNAVVVVRNSTAYPQIIKKKTLVAPVVAATMVPELPVMINLLEGVAEPHSLQTP